MLSLKQVACFMPECQSRFSGPNQNFNQIYWPGLVRNEWILFSIFYTYSFQNKPTIREKPLSLIHNLPKGGNLHCNDQKTKKNPSHHTAERF